MQKKYVWMLAAILICGASVFTSCTSDNADNPASVPTFPQPGDTWDAATGTLTVNSNPGKGAYEGRTDIVSVVFSDTVTSIGDRAFYNCHISVVDLPASVTSIGNDAFSGEKSSLGIVTIYATDCAFGEHPFVQSILTNVYVPAASLDAYETKYPEYSEKISQFHAIPEAKQEGSEIIWSNALCKYIQVGIPYYHKDRIVAAHNTQGGITVNFAITDEDSGFDIGCITLVQGEKLTFTSTVGNISKITIQTIPYEYDEEDDEEDEPYIPVAEGWTWDTAKHTFTWQGTPSATVEMLASDDVDLESVQISFTIDGSAPSPDTTVLTEWQAGKTVDAATVEAYGGIDKCFAAEPIPDGVWARMQGKTFKENPYCDRSWDFPYKITHDDLCFKLFTEAGFEWGGDWTTRKDYQHFEIQ